jgi:GT2 family glycosyltransferase
MTTEDTMECVESIREKCRKERYRIIIVDNASPNGSAEELQNLYGEAGDVDLIFLQENQGFARGNNEGIKLAREKYSPDFIVALNNDVVLLEENMVETIRAEYLESEFSVLGPMIYTADGRCNDNPGRNQPMTVEEICDQIVYGRRSMFLFKWHLWKPYRLLEIMKRMVCPKHRSKIQQARIYECYLKKAINVQLHGCFLCFSKKYFEFYEGFYPKTFLNMEEDILFYLTQKQGLVTVYTPEVKIYHKEDRASIAKWSSDKERVRKKTQYVLESAMEFKKLCENE